MKKRGYYTRGLTLSDDEIKQNYTKIPDIGFEPVVCKTPFDKYLKIYNDGNHFVATEVRQGRLKKKDRYAPKPFEFLNNIFDKLYLIPAKKNLCSKEAFAFIKKELLETYCLVEDSPELDEYIQSRIKLKLNNFHKKVKRVRRKAYLNKWNYFVAITFDSKKHTAEDFRKKLLKTFANFHTRRNWRCMGFFELGEENERLHFHGLFYIPDGEMVGELVKVRDYSTKKHKMQETTSNTFFAKKFGRCDFQKIDNVGKALDYMMKYIMKNNERLFCSRGILGEICKLIPDEDIATNFIDFVMKYVLFDDVIDFNRDILGNTA